MKLLKWVGGLGLCVLLAPFFLLLFVWLRIKYQPLPPVPPSQARYRVVDVGDAGRVYIFGNDLFNLPGRLNALGQVEPVDETAQRARGENARQQRAAYTTRHRLAPGSALFVQGDVAVLRTEPRGWQVRSGQRVLQTVPERVVGYQWRLCDLVPHAVAENGTVVGHANIATACASSGGASEPHGRPMAIVTRNGALHDLNSLIHQRDGWYLDYAVDINARGQILCLGRRLSPQQSESSVLPFRWLVLSPL